MTAKVTWGNITFGKGAGVTDFILRTIEGLDGPDPRIESTPRQSGGTSGGLIVPDERVIDLSCDLIAASGFSKLLELQDAMDYRSNPADEAALLLEGMIWPEVTCAFVRPTRMPKFLISEDLTEFEFAEDSAIQWTGTDPTIYSSTPVQRVWDSGDPVSSDEFAVANAGRLVRSARRAWRLRMTAHGSLVGPWVRVDHADGTWERIGFPGLTIPSGHVLKIEENLQPRVQGAIKTKYLASTSNFSATPTVAPRWWKLHPGTTGDEVNVVSVGCTSGTFSGFLETRGTW